MIRMAHCIRHLSHVVLNAPDRSNLMMVDWSHVEDVLFRVETKIL